MYAYLHPCLQCSLCHSLQSTPSSPRPATTAAHARVRLQAALAGLLADMRRARMPAALVDLMADMARTEGRQLPEADYAAQVSLEALRLEDPAAMSGCWNPGCAAALALAGCPWTLDKHAHLS